MELKKRKYEKIPFNPKKVSTNLLQINKFLLQDVKCLILNDKMAHFQFKL